MKTNPRACEPRPHHQPLLTRRDVDSNELGHNTSFVPRAANNVATEESHLMKRALLLLV